MLEFIGKSNQSNLQISGFQTKETFRYHCVYIFTYFSIKKKKGKYPPPNQNNERKSVTPKILREEEKVKSQE
jgi:hypothetical protein